MKLSTDRLTTGLYIKLPCSWSEHPFLLGSFKIQDHEQIKVLRSLNIKHVIFFPEKSDTEPLPENTEKPYKEKNNTQDEEYLQVLWAEKKQSVKAQKQYLKNLKKCNNEFKKSLSNVRAINLKMINQGPQALAAAIELISSITNKLNGSQNIVLHLMEDDNTVGYKYHNHAFHTAILAMILGKVLQLSEEEITYLGLGALFHDLGLVQIPNQIIRNNPDITQAEKNYYKQHVRYTLDRLKNIPNLPQPVLNIVSQHHEYLDGSGYPNKLNGEQICLLAQIVTVADKYDSLCNPSNKFPSHSPYHALAHLYKNRSKQLNKKILALLIKELGIYPPGSIVQLCNQKYALVMSVAKSNILLPNVLIYDPSVPKNDAAIIPLSQTELKIEKAIISSQVPKEVQEYLNPCTRINYYFENTQ